MLQILINISLLQTQWLLIYALLPIFGLIITIKLFRKSQKRDIENLLHVQKTKAAKEIIDEYEKIDNWIAKELHDDIGGSIAAIRFNMLSTLDEIKKEIATIEKPETGKASFEMEGSTLMSFIKSRDEEITALGDLNNKIRKLSHNLVPVSFDGQSFSDLLKVKLSSLFKDSMIFSFQCYPEGELNDIRDDIKFNIYRILQNLASNAIVHSKAKNVTIHVVGHKDHLSSLVEDDGIGFDKEKQTDGIGLQLTKKRVLLFDGEIEIDSQKGKGTTITIDVPYKNVKI